MSLPALLLGSIAPDIQSFIIMFLNQPGTLRGRNLNLAKLHGTEEKGRKIMEAGIAEIISFIEDLKKM